MKQNNCQGCGCINQDQCICLKDELNNIMKEQYKDRYTTLHPAGVSITFTSWQDYNKYMVYNHDTRKEYCEQAYETGIKDGIKKAKESNGLQNLLIYEAGVEDGIAKVKEKVSKGQDKSNKDNSQIYEADIEDGIAKVKDKVIKGQDKCDKDKSQSKLELVEPAEIKVKVNNMQEFLDIWDVLYPKK